MSHTTFDVPFDACGLSEEERSVLVFGERVALRFDRDLHAATTVTPEASAPQQRDAGDVDPVTAELLWHGLREDRAMKDGELFSSLLDVAGNVRAQFEGELRSIAIAGELYAAVVLRADEACESIVGRLAPSGEIPTSATVLGTAVAVTPTASDGVVVAVTTETPLAIHLVRLAPERDPGFVRVSLPLVHDRVLGLVVAHERAYCLSKRALDVVDLQDLPFERGDTSLPARFAPFVPRGSREAEPATVVMMVGQSALLQHPRLGRLRLVRHDDDPTLAKGDELVLEDVLEKLPGLFEVRRWHTVSGPSSSRPPPAMHAESRPAPVVTPRA